MRTNFYCPLVFVLTMFYCTSTQKAITDALSVEIPDFIHPVVSAFTLHHSWSVILPCLSTPLPYFSVTWWYNGDELRSQSTRYISHSGNLHVYEATFRSNGSYHCTVRNQMTNETFTGPTLHLLVTTGVFSFPVLEVHRMGDFPIRPDTGYSWLST